MFALIMMAMGTVLKAYGDIAGGISQGKMADRNALVAMQQAQAARAAAAVKAQLTRKKGERLKAAQRAKMAVTGAEITSKSFLEVAGETEKDIALDVATVLWGGETEARRFESQAAMDRWTGKVKKRAGWIKGFGTLLGGTAGINLAAGGAGSASKFKSLADIARF